MSAVPLPLCDECGLRPRVSSHHSARFCSYCGPRRGRAIRMAFNKRAYWTRKAEEVRTGMRANTSFRRPERDLEEWVESVASGMAAYEKGRQRYAHIDRWAAWPSAQDWPVVVPVVPADTGSRRRAPWITLAGPVNRTLEPDRGEHSEFCAECSAVVFMRAFGMLGKEYPQMGPKRKR